MRRIAPRTIAVLDRLNKKTPPLMGGVFWSGRRGSLAALSGRHTHTGTKTCHRHVFLAALVPFRDSARLDQKETPSVRMVFLFVIAHRFCCPCALLYIARKGMYARETLVGFPLHVKSPARRRPLLRSKSAAPKRKTPLRVSFFLERATRLELATSTLARSRSTR